MFCGIIDTASRIGVISLHSFKSVFGGEKVKVISKRVSVGLLSLVFLLALVSASPVAAKVPLRWNISAVYYGGVGGYPDWYGEIVTDDGIHGEFSMWITDAIFLSNGQKLQADWYIDWGNDQYLEGNVKGTFVYATHDYLYDGGDYVCNGFVTGASLECSDLDGRNVHIMGHITPYWTTEAMFQIN